MRVALLFMLRGYHSQIRFTNGRYDITLMRAGQDGTRSVEVKWDKRASESGNLYFEVENTRQQKPSGVMATTADLWCHVLGEGERGLIVTVPSLRRFLKEGSWRSVHTRGADSNSRGLLVPWTAVQTCSDFRPVRLPTVEDYFGAIFRQASS
ncbi:hypothetical protein DYH09_22135 [bacterium CPR1]|nr:hypothetical protein [bacterium CPR1]